MRIETKDELYLHGHRFRPRFLVDDGDKTNGYRPRGFFCEGPPWVGEYSIPVRSFAMSEMQVPEVFHARLHQMLGNTCGGDSNRQARYNGRDGFYGDLVRREIACFDTPLIDIDAVEAEGVPPLILALVEYKRPGEVMRPFQAAMIQGWRRAGGTYLIEERDG